MEVKWLIKSNTVLKALIKDSSIGNAHLTQYSFT